MSENRSQAMSGYFVSKIGSNRGRPRIWLEGLPLTTASIAPGSRYDVHMKGGTIVIQANPDGSRVVTTKKRGDRELPVIDLNSTEMLALFDGMSAVRLVQREGQVFILPLATEVRKKERLNRLRRKLETGEPLNIASLSHGGGILTHALHKGMEAGGVKTRLAIANEIRTKLLQHASQANDAWDKNTIPLGAPLQYIAFDQKAVEQLPLCEGGESGLPCSGASVAGQAQRQTSVPEEHPEVGHLIVSALVILARVNPAFWTFENVIPYANSASAAILRTQLKDLGYKTYETVIDGEDFNAVDTRKRWVMVAVTEGMSFDWSMLQQPIKNPIPLSEYLEAIPPDDPAWSEMQGLKDKMKRDLESGSNFAMRVFGSDATKIGTITKGYQKVRSTDPKLMHPTDPNLLRQFTAVEHARFKQVPENLIAGLSSTIAHEVLGQGIVYDPFEKVGTLIAESLLSFVGRLPERPSNVGELINAIKSEVADTADMIVSEIRKPLAGVTYEGRITMNDLGMAIQDIGNGVGILHKALTLGDIQLGESIKIRYPTAKSAPQIMKLEENAPAITPVAVAAIAEHKEQVRQAEIEMEQFSLALAPDPEPSQPLRGMRMG